MGKNKRKIQLVNITSATFLTALLHVELHIILMYFTPQKLREKVL